MAAAPSVANDTQFCKLIPNFENSSKSVNGLIELQKKNGLDCNIPI
jgi:hypothetical protein